jgi:DNA-binding transcriptional ArsR family regulator
MEKVGKLESLQEIIAEMTEPSGTGEKPTRIAIIEVLPDGELPAGAIIERLGLEQANTSQHLAVLRAKQIVNSRREGNQIFYSVRDSVLIEVLDIMRRYFQAHVGEAMAMLKENS